jgi:Na+/H+-dicarboxylate symporter
VNVNARVRDVLVIRLYLECSRSVNCRIGFSRPSAFLVVEERRCYNAIDTRPSPQISTIFLGVPMSLTIRVLLGLILGLVAGAAVAATQRPSLLASVGIVEALGSLWLNALRMTVIPLIVSLLVVGFASASEAAAAGRVGKRTLVVVTCLYIASGVYTALAAALLLGWIPVNESTAAALRSDLGGQSAAEVAVPGFAEWITGLVPANPIQAAAEGSILPLVFFSVLLGLAAARLAAELRERLLGFFRALGEAMMVIVHWVLQLAPLGVFALVFPFGASAGVGVVRALAHYVLLTSVLCVLATLVLYPLTALLSEVTVRRFAGAAAPAQLVAFSTRSSLASLPAMLDGAKTRLGLPSEVSGVVLPLTVSILRFTMPITNLGAAIFGAALFGITLSPRQLAAGAAVAVLVSLAGVGLPGQADFMGTMAPIFLVMGVPLEVLGLMLAVDTIPDTFATVGNVTADLAATAFVARGAASSEEPVPAVAEVSASFRD